MFITKRKLNKKLDVLLSRQNFLAECIFCQFYTYDGAKKMEKKWNKIWHQIMEDDDDERG